MAARFQPPPVETVWNLTAPLRAYHRPWFTGLEHIDPARPSLLVGNHTIYGVLDAPHMLVRIYKERGVWVRSLGDRLHFRIPGWGDFLKSLGVVVGTRENCSRLMRNGAHVLVFPGGGREVTKRKGEAYKLIWKERTGFARMAIEHGYPITPFASVGPEDCYDILVDARDVMKSPLGKFLERTGIMESFFRGGEMIPPIARGLGFTMLPRPERFYFAFGEPIETRHLRGKHDDPAVLFELRETVRDAVEALIRRLQALRARDPRRNLLERLLPKQRRR